MAQILKQSTAYTFRLGPFVDKTDGNTQENSLTIAYTDVLLSKAGGALAAKNDTTALTATGANAHYTCVLNATDTNTLGGLRVWCHISADALPVWQDFIIVPANVYDSLVAGSDNLQVDTIQWLGTACATPTTAGVPEVDVTHVAGTAQTARDLGQGIPNAVPGAEGGLLIAGSNAATTFASITVSGTCTFTGNVSYAAGITITQSTANGHGISITGNGTGHGINTVGGSTSGHGIKTQGGAATSHGISAVGGVSGYSIDASDDIAGSITGSVDSVTGTVGSVATGVTVTTNNDKTGYSLSSAGIQAIWEYTTRTLTAFSTSLALSVWDVLESAIATANSIGLKLKTNLDATVSSRLSSAGYTAPDNAGISSILTESQSHPTLAEIEATTVLAKEATVAAIKTKTDTIAWTDITDIKDATLGKWSINKSTNVLTMYKADGVTVLKQFNLTDNASVTERVPV